MSEWLSRGIRIAIGMVRMMRNGNALCIACEISIELALTHMARADQTGFLAADMVGLRDERITVWMITTDIDRRRVALLLAVVET